MILVSSVAATMTQASDQSNDEPTLDHILVRGSFQGSSRIPKLDQIQSDCIGPNLGWRSFQLSDTVQGIEPELCNIIVNACNG